MKWIKIGLYILILYGFQHQQLFISSAKYKNKDKRVVKLQNYLTKKGSPLAKSAIHFVKTADKYKLDYRLLPAIAGVESGFEKAGNLYDNNPFGYMCTSSPCYFDTYADSINQVAKTISTGRAYKRYQQSGSILELAKVYCQVRNEEWTNKVQYFINQL